MRVTVVGSGTVVPSPKRRQSCVIVEAGGEMLVFDLGGGAVRGLTRAGLDPFATDRVFVTHFHPDHTVDLAQLLFTLKYGSADQRTRPLDVSGPEPFGRFWDSVTAVWGEWMSGGYPVRVAELPRENAVPLDLPGGRLSWAPARHNPESIAYRLDAGNGSFVYTGDTEYSESVVELARGAHTLLIECNSPDANPIPGHMTPQAVARTAREAGVGRVVLTHLTPAVDTSSLSSEVARSYDGEVVIAEDGMRLEV